MGGRCGSHSQRVDWRSLCFPSESAGADEMSVARVIELNPDPSVMNLVGVLTHLDDGARLLALLSALLWLALVCADDGDSCQFRHLGVVEGRGGRREGEMKKGINSRSF